MSLSAYGEGGPLSGRPGVDMVLQGMSGMMSAQGGDSEPVANTIAIIDVTTGAMLALSACLALLHRERGGTGQGPAGLGVPGRHRHLPADAARSSAIAGRPPAAAAAGTTSAPIRSTATTRPATAGSALHAPRPGEVTAEALAPAGLPVDAAAFAADPAAALAAALAGLTPEAAADG